MAELHGAVRRELVLPLPRDEAWALVADPAELATWLADDVELELVEGAEGVLRWDDGSERAVAVDEVEPGRRLALRWWDTGGASVATLVELTLDDVADGTRLTILELPLAVLEAVGAWSGPPAGGAHGPQLLATCA